MIYFKLSLLTPVLKMNQFAELNYNLTTLSEFFDQEYSYYHDKNNEKPFSNQKCSFNYTYDEKLSLHQNAQKELTFSMLNKINNDGRIEENPFTNVIHDGSLLLLNDNYGNEYIFIVKSIQYEFNENTIVYKVTCQDAFSYQLSTQNNGYTITNDSSSDDFIGAKTIDWWIYKRIVPDCHIAYKYLLMPQGLYEDNKGNLIEANSKTEVENCKRLIKPFYPDDIKDSNGNIITKQFGEYYETISFSCSGSTANAALIALVEQLDLQIRSFEYHKGTKFYKYFWVEPKKNELRPCLMYSPMSNIQNFGLTHNGESLSSILNVESNTVADELVTLLPDIPNFFYNYFQSEDWKNSNFYNGMFASILKSQDFFISLLTPSKYSLDTPTIRQNMLIIPIQGTWNFKTSYPKLKFKNSSINLIDENGQTYTMLSVNDIWGLQVTTEDATYKIYANGDEFELDFNSTPLVISLLIPWYGDQSLTLRLQDYNITISLYRDYSIEEEEFAYIADKCPWLENKLINFDYFVEHNLISANEYQILMDKITNDLRKTNGELLYYTKSYYDSLHEKTRIMAELLQDVDSISASWNYELNDIIAEKGQLGNKTNNNNVSNLTPYFSEAYTNLFDVVPSKPTAILNREELISEYFNKFFLSEQSFLKNIKQFRDYFESPCDVPDIYTTTVKIIDNQDENCWYTFGDITDAAFEPITDIKDIINNTIYYLDNRKMLLCVYATSEKLQQGQYLVCDEDDKGYTLMTDKYTYSKANKYYKRYFYITTTNSILNYNTPITVVINSLPFKCYAEQTGDLTNNRIVLMPINPQKDYVSIFKNPSGAFEYENKTYNLNQAIINYEKVSDTDILNDWLHRNYISDLSSSAKEIISNWTTRENNYELLFKGYINYNQDNNEEFDSSVKPSFYVYSKIFKNISTTELPQYERVNNNNYTMQEYQSLRDAQNTTSIGKNPKDYLEKTYINYVTPDNANQFYTRKEGSPLVFSLVSILTGSRIIATGVSSLFSRSHTPYIAGEYGYPNNYDKKWFKGYKDNEHILYAKVSNALDLNAIYRMDHNSNSMHTIRYKQNFYDLFGITYKGLKPIINNNELYCLPSVWYEPLYLDNQINAEDSLKVLSITDKEIVDKITSQIKQFNTEYNLVWNDISAWSINAELFQDIASTTQVISVQSLLASAGCSVIEQIDNTNIYKVTANSDGVLSTYYVAIFRNNTYYTKTFNLNTQSKQWVNSTIYNKITNKPYDLSTIAGIIDGFVVYNQDKDNLIPAIGNELIESARYYDKDTKSRIYTPSQLLSEKPYTVYKIKSNVYKLEEFKNNSPIVVKLVKHTWVDKIKGTYTSEVVDYQYKIARDNIESDNIYQDTVNGLTFTITSQKTVNSAALNKGNFWIKYHSDTQQAMLFERAATFETELQALWSAALNASRGCDYFIPDDWRPQTESNTNGYSSFLYNITTKDNMSTHILTGLVPTVKILTDNDGNTQLPNYIISYKENGILVSGDPIEERFLGNNIQVLKNINNSVLSNIIKNVLQSNENNWVVEQSGKRNYYYTDNPYTYGKFFSEIAKTHTGCQFTGNYLIILRRLMNLKYFTDRFTPEYDKILDRHNRIWDDIYTNFGAIIYERTYSNANALNSAELYNLASIAFKDYMIPERAYSITVINSHDLEYHGEELRVGDPIQIKADEYYNVYDSLYKSLSQYLFISDISYTLRAPTDFSLTVNNIKYEDKLLSRLINLI